MLQDRVVFLDAKSPSQQGWYMKVPIGIPDPKNVTILVVTAPGKVGIPSYDFV